jgi:hypothetical protein
MGLHISRKIAMAITIAQISQMLIGVLAVYTAYSYVLLDWPCASQLFDLKLAASLYASYAVLFLNYFIKSYFGNTPVGNTAESIHHKKIQ